MGNRSTGPAIVSRAKDGTSAEVYVVLSISVVGGGGLGGSDVMTSTCWAEIQ
jgi:hypothetical protein